MMEKKELEIMAPAGNFECLMAAIEGGADSVYFGVGNLNMRSHSDLPAARGQDISDAEHCPLSGRH